MDNTIVTSHGRTLVVRPVPRSELDRIAAQVQREFRERGEPLDPPTYTVETPIGTETYPHDEASIAEASEEEKRQWAAYQDAQRRLSMTIWLRNLRLAIIRGLGMKPGDVPAEWEEEQRLLGLDVPEDPLEKLLAYVRSELLPTEWDAQRLIAKALALSLKGMVSDEEVAALEETFLRGMDRSLRAQDESATDTREIAQPDGRTLGVQSGNGADHGGTLVGVDSSPMAQAEP